MAALVAGGDQWQCDLWGIGKLIGNEQMEAEGIVKEKKGETKQKAAKASERTKGKVQEIVGAVKNRVGAVIDNEDLQAEGKAKELEGEANPMRPHSTLCFAQPARELRLERH